MNITITPGKLAGTVAAIPSKSHAHRALICAAFADRECSILLSQVNADIEATVACLQSLGARIWPTESGYRISPVVSVPGDAVLNCGESGSTLRFLLPVVGALGVDAVFLTQGRLGMRPLSPLWEEMERMGCSLSRPDAHTIRCRGKLNGGTYCIAGNVSSQFISGLLFAGALMEEELKIRVEGTLESLPYVRMTQDVLSAFGVETGGLRVCSGSRLTAPDRIHIEGDWSSAAFFLTAGALGSDLQITGLNENSHQGDRAVSAYLEALSCHASISAADIPDLIPVLSVAAAAKQGAVFTDIRRLRLKESDRVASIIHMLRSLGANATATEDMLTVFPGGLTGGTVDSCNDHRIAMAAAIAATVCREPVTILDAEAVNKSYPAFWKDYRTLGGNYEQHLR